MKRSQVSQAAGRRGLWLAVSLLLCCGMHSPVAAQGGRNAIAEVRGRVEVKHPEWSRFVRASVGMLVRNGDLLQLTAPARARIVCADGRVLTVESASYRVQCGTSSPVIRFRGSRVSRVRAGVTVAAFPIVVSPRMTKLLDPRPTLRWLPVAGANTYRVSVIRGASTLWTHQVDGVTQLKYPDTAPELEPNVTYRLVVASGGGVSTDEGLPNLGFSLLSAAEAQAVREAEASIRALNLPEAFTLFLVAHLYATWGTNPDSARDDGWTLTAEAIDLLERGSAEQPETALFQTLGDLYLTLGVTSLAEKNYARALELAEASDDTYGRALALYALGRIFTIRLNEGEARRRLEAARELFQSFGDAESVSMVDSELTALRTP